MVRISIRALAVALLSLGATPAVADEIPAPPASCPPGSVAHSEHAGQWCAATTCTSDADCTPEAPVCREVALCVVQEEYALGGNLPADPPPLRTRRVARGECAGGACPAGGECGRVRRCAPPLSAPGSGSGSAAHQGSGCTVGRGSAAPWLLVLAAITTLWGSRRR